MRCQSYRPRDRLRCSSTGGGYYLHFVVDDGKDTYADTDQRKAPPGPQHHCDDSGNADRNRKCRRGDKGIEGHSAFIFIHKTTPFSTTIT